MTSSERKEYDRLYRQRNRARINEYSKKYAKENRAARKATEDRYIEANREKVVERKRNWKKANPDYSRIWRMKNPEKAARYDRRADLKKKYGLTEDQYAEMCRAQNNRCFICKEAAKLLVDHNHATGSVRKLLCVYCNTAIGYLRERHEVAIDVAAYLREFGAAPC